MSDYIHRLDKLDNLDRLDRQKFRQIQIGQARQRNRIDKRIRQTVWTG